MWRAFTVDFLDRIRATLRVRGQLIDDRLEFGKELRKEDEH